MSFVEILGTANDCMCCLDVWLLHGLSQKRGKGLDSSESGDYSRTAPVILSNASRAASIAAPSSSSMRDGGVPSEAGGGSSGARGDSGKPPLAPSVPKQAPKTARGRPIPNGPAQQSNQEQSSSAAAKKAAEDPMGDGGERPERVRAGFGIYQPKRRGRLEEAPKQAYMGGALSMPCSCQRLILRR